VIATSERVAQYRDRGLLGSTFLTRTLASPEVPRANATDIATAMLQQQPEGQSQGYKFAKPRKKGKR